MTFWKFTGSTSEFFPGINLTAKPGYVYNFGSITPPTEALPREGVRPTILSNWTQVSGPATDFALKTAQASDLTVGSPSPTSTIVMWGDSHLANGGGDGEQSTSTSTPLRSRGAVNWALALLNARGSMAHNGGNAGQRTDEILLRYGTDVSPFAPGIVVLNGGINNVLQLVTATSSTIATTVAGVKADILAMVSAVKIGGATPVLLTLPPMSTMTANQVNAWTQINRWIRSLPASVAGLVVCDWIRRVVSTSAAGVWATNMSYDGTHAAAIGAARMGADLALTLDRLLPVIDVSPTFVDSLDLITNGLMTGTAGFMGGGVTGSVADGWTAASDGGSVTAVASKVARTDGAPGEWQQFAVSAGTGIRCYASLDAGEWAIGDLLYATWEFQTDSNLTVGSLTDFYATVSTIGTSSLSQSIKNAGSDSLNDPACRISAGVFRTYPIVIPTGTTDVRVEFHMTGATGTFRLGRVSVYKVGAFSG